MTAKEKAIEPIWKIIYFIFVAICLWTATTSVIQAFKCPTMTQTELLLHTPKSFILELRSKNRT